MASVFLIVFLPVLAWMAIAGTSPEDAAEHRQVPSLSSASTQTCTTSQSTTTSAPNGPQCSQTAFPVPNCGFETGKIGPWRTTGDGSVTIVTPGNGSAHAAQLAVGGGHSANMFQPGIKLCAGRNYTVSFAYQVLNGSGGFVMFADADRGPTAGREHGLYFHPAAADGWTVASFAYPNPVATSVELSVGIACDNDPCSGGVQIDDVAIADAGSLAAPGCPRAVPVANGGFDSGQLAPWRPAGFAIDPPSLSVVAPGFNGSAHALRLAYAATNRSSFALQQRVAGWCVDYRYTLAFAVRWLNYTFANPEACALTLYAYSTGQRDTSYARQTVYPANNSGSAWRAFAFQRRATTNAPGLVSLEIDCVRVNTSRPAIPPFSVEVDSVSVQLA